MTKVIQGKYAVKALKKPVSFDVHDINGEVHGSYALNRSSVLRHL